MTNTTNNESNVVNMLDELCVRNDVVDKPMTEIIADGIADAAARTADAIEDTVINTYVNLVSGYDRTAVLVTRLATETPRIRKAAQTKAQARLDARFGKLA